MPVVIVSFLIFPFRVVSRYAWFRPLRRPALIDADLQLSAAKRETKSRPESYCSEPHRHLPDKRTIGIRREVQYREEEDPTTKPPDFLFPFFHRMAYDTRVTTRQNEMMKVMGKPRTKEYERFAEGLFDEVRFKKPGAKPKQIKVKAK